MDTVDSIEDWDLQPGFLGGDRLYLGEEFIPLLGTECHVVNVQNGSNMLVDERMAKFVRVEFVCLWILGIRLTARNGAQSQLSHLARFLLQSHPAQQGRNSVFDFFLS